MLFMREGILGVREYTGRVIIRERLSSVGARCARPPPSLSYQFLCFSNHHHNIATTAVSHNFEPNWWFLCTSKDVFYDGADVCLLPTPLSLVTDTDPTFEWLGV